MAVNIIGNPFPSLYINQINMRQQKLSQTDSIDTIKYKTSKTSFIRLMSSVDVTSDANSLARKSLSGISNIDKLAENYILDNTYSRYGDGGVGYGRTYGWASNSDYGFVPPPGILSADIKSLNNGSLREATVKITCHNLQQFKIIDALYLRLKYTMLLEWGHTLYFNNSGELKRGSRGTTNTIFFEKTTTFQKVLFSIQMNRNSTSGNYDGFLGQVKNFDWTLRNDGGYDITLSLISVGDIVESLKINPNYPGLQSTSTPNNPYPAAGQDPNILPPTEAGKDNSAFHQILSTIKKTYEDALTVERVSMAAISITMDSLAQSVLDNGYEIKPTYKTDDSKGNNEVCAAIFDSLGVDIDGSPSTGALIYIKLGALLRIIQAFLLKYDTSKTDKDPICFINYDYDSNYCLTLEQQTSLDPKVCLLRPHENIASKLAAISGLDNERKLYNIISDDEFRVDGNSYLGKFLHIYVNIDYIVSTLDRNVNAEGKVPLFVFLTDLMKGIQMATGCINNFEVTYSTEENEVIIRDINIPIGLNDNSTLAEFNTHKLTTTEGSFMLDVSLKSELNNAFASIITIGAQAQGNKVGENSTNLSRLNDGYTDRIISKKSSVTDDAIEAKPAEDAWKTVRDNYVQSLVAIYELICTDAQNQSIKQSVVDYFKYILGSTANDEKKSDSCVGLLPLNLQLKMDGLSGMDIYQAYTIDDQVLPPAYKNKFQFIIKGISHHIDDKGWVTVLDSISGPKRKGATTIQEKYDINPTFIPIPDPPQNGGGGQQFPATPPSGLSTAWRIVSNGLNVADSQDLYSHHEGSRNGRNPYATYVTDPYDPTTNPNGMRRETIQVTSGQLRHPVGGFVWSVLIGTEHLFPDNCTYVFDFTLYRDEGSGETNQCWVPSPVDGVVKSVSRGSGRRGSGAPSLILIKGSDGKNYKLVHGVNFSKAVGDSVSRGDLLFIQDSIGPSTGIHTHIEFPDRYVLDRYIESLNLYNGSNF